jgi:Zn-dependent peptidase ImmA (M78 family)/transcriptional regulator with XRE-family HTH domain
MATEANARAEALGAKLRRGRTLHRITQEAAASKLGMARTTLVAIEAGKRAVSSQELRQFAELYDVPEGELINDDVAPLELEVEFRSSATEWKAADEVLVASMLNRLGSSALQLEALLGQAPPRVDLPAVAVSKSGSLAHQAEDSALQLRSRFGIGLGPIQNLSALMEFEMGLRVFERPLPSKISGAVAFSEKVGGFVLLNSLHPPYRRRVTGAHEVGHALTRQTCLVVHFDGETRQSRTERFCDLFGIAFLAPATTVRRKAKELKDLFGQFSVRQLLMMAVFFNISIEAMTRRLESLDMLPAGTYDSLRKQGVGLEHRRRVAEEMSVPEENQPFTPRSLLLAGVAYERELLSEQQIASMLELNLVDVRRALQERDGHVGEVVLDLVE